MASLVGAFLQWASASGHRPFESARGAIAAIERQTVAILGQLRRVQEWL